MSDVVYKVGIYGDLHLYSENYGGHRDYASESLIYLRKITELTKNLGLTHLIGLGDFSFGNFRKLTYRKAVEAELAEQYKLVNGNRWELFGNHDFLPKDISERDYYIGKGLLKSSENITIGHMNINMVDNGKVYNTPVVIDNDHTNIVLAHDYFKFNGINLPNYGDAIILDNFEPWYGADYLICGHIHKCMAFNGSIVKGDKAHQMMVDYPGCAMRPAFIRSGLDEKVHISVFTEYSDGRVEFSVSNIELLPIEESFNLEKIEKKFIKEEEKPQSIDISDMVYNLDKHERVVGTPEVIIGNMQGIPDTWKNKAIELLKSAVS